MKMILSNKTVILRPARTSRGRRLGQAGPGHPPGQSRRICRHRSFAEFTLEAVISLRMTAEGLRMTGVLLGGLLCVASLSFSATENLEFSADAKPLRFVAVDGDAGKFSAHHWVADHYTGGIDDFSAQYTLPKDIEVSMDGHALVDENDLGGNFEIRKKDFGFVALDYSEFRKYYSGLGGVYYPFTSLRVNKLDRELALDIGHLRLETGLTIEDWPRLTLMYEREFKDGTKSRLTWTPVKEGSLARNIGPSWQEINEVVDTFALKAEHDIAGFNLSGDQRWEYVRSETTREEDFLATTGVAADNKIRVQTQNPESNLMTSTFGVERWFKEDKLFTAGAFRYAHMTNQELENILEMNQFRNVVNFTNPKQIRDARADNEYHNYIWTGNLMVIPKSWLSVSTKLKSEIFKRRGSSTYPSDTTPVAAGGAAPDGIINNTEVSENDQKAQHWGEGVSFRFTAIPRTALYTEAELEQVRNWLSEDRDSIGGQSAPNTGEIFNRETITYVRRGVWTVGAHMAPWRFLNVTTHFRQRRNNNDYDDKHETDPGATTARSAFIDAQNVHTHEFMMRAALRPFFWLQPAFRYQFRGDDYLTRAENQPQVEADMNSHIYTFDLTTQPVRNLMTNISFSRQTARTVTPAVRAVTGTTPAFNANVNTWLLGTEYYLPHEVIFTGSLEYSRADNFNDFTSIGLPLGVDNESVDLDVGFKIPLYKSVSLHPSYRFYYFKANQNAEGGDYNAHVVSMDVSVTWT